MALTKEQRDALPDSDFAVPETRDLPIHDERHIRMAWSMVKETKELSDAQRHSARKHILRKAHELGLDTSKWEVRASYVIDAMALAMPEVADHPNRMPFSGILTRIDEASDLAPEGSDKKRTYIPREVAEDALPSLLGMGVDCMEDLEGHNHKRKIGVITEATIRGNAIHIAGFLYSKDFPRECARIKAEKNRLGFSYEASVAVEDRNADPWMIVWCVFTGAAILYKEKAAYQSTSLAASAASPEKKRMTPEELKALMDSIGAIQASVASVTKEVATLKAGASLGGPIIDQVRPHVEACNAAAASMRSAGIGTHPEFGHARHLEKVAAHMATEAAMGRMPQIYHENNPSLSAAADKAKEAQEAALKPINDALKTITDTVTALGTKITDLQAAAKTAVVEPARRTLSPETQALLSKIGLSAAAEKGEKLTTAQVDEVLGKAKLDTQSRIAAKVNLQAAGML